MKQRERSRKEVEWKRKLSNETEGAEREQVVRGTVVLRVGRDPRVGAVTSAGQKGLNRMWNKVMIAGRMRKSADQIGLGEMVHNNIHVKQYNYM
jgi:hypothetical protein